MTQELLQRLKSENVTVRWRAVADLSVAAGIKDEVVLSILADALADEHPFVRWLAGKSLAQSEAGRRRLSTLLETGSQQVRATAADAFYYADANDVTALEKTLSDADSLVRQSAVEVLARKRQQLLVPHLNNLLHDDSPWIRRVAARVMGHRGDSQNIGVLVELLSDESPLVRRSAAYALGAMRARAATRLLVDALDDPDPAVRRNAAWSLGRIGDESVAENLQGLLKDRALDGEVAAEAAHALSSIRGPFWRRLSA